MLQKCRRALSVDKFGFYFHQLKTIWIKFYWINEKTKTNKRNQRMRATVKTFSNLWVLLKFFVLKAANCYNSKLILNYSRRVFQFELKFCLVSIQFLYITLVDKRSIFGTHSKWTCWQQCVTFSHYFPLAKSESSLLFTCCWDSQVKVSPRNIPILIKNYKSTGIRHRKI